MTKLLLLLLSTAAVLASKKGRDHLLFGFLTPLALGIASSAAIILVVSLIVACYFDNRSRRGLSKSAMSHPPSRWVPRETQIRQGFTNKDIPKSDDDPSTALNIDDLRGETVHKVQPPSVSCSSRLDPQMKHNKIIEAIYKASGRELPEEYKTKGGAAEVHGTKELNKHHLSAIEESVVEKSQNTQSSEKPSKEEPKSELTQKSEKTEPKLEVEMKTANSPDDEKKKEQSEKGQKKGEKKGEDNTK